MFPTLSRSSVSRALFLCALCATAIGIWMYYSLSVRATAPCGNGIIEQYEGCDDGNKSGGDGCDSTCKQEDGNWTCAGVIGGKSICQYCGNGKPEGTEECDDANWKIDDGCSKCKLTIGWFCKQEKQSNGGYSSQCEFVGNSLKKCGNGVINTGEECDLGPRFASGRFQSTMNTGNNGCTADCKIATGWRCSSLTPFTANYSYNDFRRGATTCSLIPVCGNGSIETGERCDMGNKNGTGKGCTSTCTKETGFVCSGSPSICSLCGNGKTDEDEECDLGLERNGTAGCTADCKNQDGWTCNRNSPTPYCNRAQCGGLIKIVDGGEDCDLGAVNGTDFGCLSDCHIQQGWKCPTTMASGFKITQTCDMLTCGNGKIDPGETCDDGNQVATDGCNKCKLNAGALICPTPMRPGLISKVCSPCGNGVIETGEECEDGKSNYWGDGCSLACKVELGWYCNVPNSTNRYSSCFKTVCGDGKQHNNEECDDGSRNNNGGAVGSCTTSCIRVKQSSAYPLFHQEYNPVLWPPISRLQPYIENFVVTNNGAPSEEGYSLFLQLNQSDNAFGIFKRCSLTDTSKAKVSILECPFPPLKTGESWTIPIQMAVTKKANCNGAKSLYSSISINKKLCNKKSASQSPYCFGLHEIPEGAISLGVSVLCD